jgi:hypothetical protein
MGVTHMMFHIESLALSERSESKGARTFLCARIGRSDHLKEQTSIIAYNGI